MAIYASLKFNAAEHKNHDIYQEKTFFLLLWWGVGVEEEVHINVILPKMRLDKILTGYYMTINKSSAPHIMVQNSKDLRIARINVEISLNNAEFSNTLDN